MSGLQELQARQVLRAVGLSGQGEVTRAASVSNEVWMTEHAVIRLSRDESGRLAREASIAEILPPEVGYPPVLGTGLIGHLTYLVVQRVPGRPLAHVWPGLSDAERRTAVQSLGGMLRHLHETSTPDVAPLDDPPQPLGHDQLLAPFHRAVELACRVPGVDQLAVREAANLVETTQACLRDYTAAKTLVHGDVTFENVLWHDGDLVALLDFEYTRAAPADLDLDILLRMCAHPDLFVDDDHMDHARSADYAEVPRHLAEAHPTMFASPSLRDRLRIYAVTFNVRELTGLERVGPSESLPAGHPQSRLVALINRSSYLDRLSF